MTTGSAATPAGALEGLSVVVTRPAEQAGGFADLLHEAGARAIAFPALRIEPVKLAAGDRERLKPDNFDWAIYLSANAVEQSLTQLPRPGRAKVAAIGKATSRSLISHGIRVHAVPTTSQDSEGLLRSPAFASAAGQSILLLRGVGGRELLRETLSGRGATVEIAELYRRAPVAVSRKAADNLKQEVADSPRATVAVTSIAILDGLLSAVPRDVAAFLQQLPLLVPGPRVATAAVERGWRGRLIVAESAENSSMVAALLRDSASGAEDAP